MGATESKRLTFLAEGDGVMLTEEAIRAVALQQRAQQQQQSNQTGDTVPRPGAGGGQNVRIADLIDVAELQQALKELRQRSATMDEALQRAFDEGRQQGEASERHQKEHELRLKEIEWQKRMDDAMRKREDEDMEEFNRTVAALSTRFEMSKPTVYCGNERTALLNCYKQHPGRTLDCAPLLDSFSACAARARQDFLARQR